MAKEIRGNDEPTGSADNSESNGDGPPDLLSHIPEQYFYKMNHRHRGTAIIFCHELFDLARNNFERRSGTHHDCENLKNTLNKLGFNVKICHDFFHDQIIQELKNVAAMNHTENDALVVCVLSHGTLGNLACRETVYDVNTLWAYFTDEQVPSLAGKPRLFFIQACRGDVGDNGCAAIKEDNEENCAPTTEVEAGPAFPFKSKTNTLDIPDDHLVYYSTAPDHVSFRYIELGSWFIRELCLELNANGERYELLRILHHVNNAITEHESNNAQNPRHHKKKQAACIEWSLTKFVRFTPKACADNNGIELEQPSTSEEQISQNEETLVPANSTNGNMVPSKRNLAITFDNTSFDLRKPDNKNGPTPDAVTLNQLYKRLDFEVREPYQNLELHQIHETLRKISRSDHTGRNMIAITVFTKAQIWADGLMLRAKDYFYNEKLLLKYFTGDECPTMANKVKLINIVTSQEAQDVDLNDKKRTVIDGPEQKAIVRIPTQANFIICYSTIKGSISDVDKSTGTRFVRGLCSVFEEFGDKCHLAELLTLVKHYAASEHDPEDPENSPPPRDMTEKLRIHSRLIKLLHFPKIQNAIAMTSENELHDLDLTNDEAVDELGKGYDGTIVAYVESVNEVQEIRSTKHGCLYKLLKCVLNNGGNKRIEVVAWGNQAERAARDIKKNYVILLSSAGVEKDINTGRLGFRLVIKERTTIQYCRTIADEDIVILPTPFLSLHGISDYVYVEGFIFEQFIIKDKRDGGKFIVGSITDGTYKMQITVTEPKLIDIPKGQKIRVFGFDKNNNNLISLQLETMTSIVILEETMPLKQLLKGTKHLEVPKDQEPDYSPPTKLKKLN